ncbi:hypothetical protein BKA56DRAFT_607526 [Ilyonectria sp. MPI-CAGE-AT-0026]|nr:hypothetical protein BKA56DRAFT_607526 [Ilyonectria sp. MPI-CAGE-AT-0026]
MCKLRHAIYQCSHTYQQAPIPCAAARRGPKGWFSWCTPSPPPCHETRSYRHANGYCPSCIILNQAVTRAPPKRRPAMKKRRQNEREIPRERDRVRVREIQNERERARTRERARRRLDDGDMQQIHIPRNSRAVIENPVGLNASYYAVPTKGDELFMPPSNSDNTLRELTTQMVLNRPYHSEQTMVAEQNQPKPDNPPRPVSPLTASELNGSAATVSDLDPESDA